MFIFNFLNIYLFGCVGSLLQHLGSLVVACGILVPWPGIEPQLPAWGVWHLSHWTTRAVPISELLISFTVLKVNADSMGPYQASSVTCVCVCVCVCTCACESCIPLCPSSG